MTMRVVMLGLYPPDPRHILGGVEAVTYLLTRALARHPDVEVHIITLRAGISQPQTLEREGVHVHLLPQPRFSRLTWHRAGTHALRRHALALAPDIVHAHGSDVYAAAAVSGPWPHVVTIHGVMAREAPTVWGLRRRLAREVDRWFERYVLARARNIIAISPYVRDAYPWLRARFHFVENPVNPRYFQTPAEAMVPGRVLCVARVIPRKDVLGLIRAFARVASDFPHATLHIAGEMTSFPEYAQACREAARRHGLTERVRFLGPLDEQALQQEYAQAQVVALTSVQETAPVVITEAMAAGRPVVATAVGGVPYMVEAGKTGWLVPPGDTDVLVSALASALQSPDACIRMGEAARQEALARFHPDRVAEQHVRVYRQVVGGEV